MVLCFGGSVSVVQLYVLFWEVKKVLKLQKRVEPPGILVSHIHKTGKGEPPHKGGVFVVEPPGISTRFLYQNHQADRVPKTVCVPGNKGEPPQCILTIFGFLEPKGEVLKGQNHHLFLSFVF